MAEWKYSATPS